MTTGIQIEQKADVFFIKGVLDEYADLSPLLDKPAPLRLDLRGLTRLNSIGIRNMLKFLAGWGDKPLVYEHCTSEFIDQVSMIPALLGIKKQGTIASLYVPYECNSCDHEEDIYRDLPEYSQALKTGVWPKEICKKCGTSMQVISDTFFAFAASKDT